MNVVIPMAGRGERFKSSGFDKPKPIIDIDGQPMIKRAVDSLGINSDSVKYIFILYDYDKEEYNKGIRDAIYSCVDDPKIIKINYTTEGPASSVLLAKELINNDEPLMTANCDQIMEWDSTELIRSLLSKGDIHSFDGCVVTYPSTTKKNSYIKVDDYGCAVQVAEKKVISNNSLNGIHFWSKGSLFVDSAEKMIRKNLRINGEFYIAESYNELIRENYRITNFVIHKNEHWAVGTPDDLAKYLEHLNEKV